MDKKSEILFLLIGNNPLPNYVAAKLLAKPLENFGKPILCLIHSKDTEPYALNLKKVLGEENFHFLFGEVNPWDFSSIQKKVNEGIEAVKTLSKKNPDLKFSVGLNYTGGTKAMSVHAYRAIKTLENDGFKVHYSYLDSNDKSMRFDVEDGSQNIPIPLYDPTKDEFELTKISLENLLALHGWNKLNPPRSQARFPNTLKTLLQIHLNKDWSDKYYQQIRKNIFREFEREFNQQVGDYKAHTRDNNRNKYETFLRTKQIDLENFDELKESLIKDLDGNVIQNNSVMLNNLSVTSSAIDFYQFLDSFWLEDYVLQEVKANEDACKLHDSFSNFIIKLPKKNNPFFEIDVISMRGYQLFAVSCTILQEVGECKKKLFEVVHRAKQLGGAEAKIGLVCLAKSDSVNSLNEQLRDDHIRVFGKDDLSGLKSKLKRWFEGI